MPGFELRRIGQWSELVRESCKMVASGNKRHHLTSHSPLSRRCRIEIQLCLTEVQVSEGKNYLYKTDSTNLHNLGMLSYGYSRVCSPPLFRRVQNIIKITNESLRIIMRHRKTFHIVPESFTRFKLGGSINTKNPRRGGITHLSHHMNNLVWFCNDFHLHVSLLPQKSYQSYQASWIHPFYPIERKLLTYLFSSQTIILSLPKQEPQVYEPEAVPVYVFVLGTSCPSNIPHEYLHW